MNDTPRHWQPLVECTDFAPVRIEIVHETMTQYGIDEPAARALLQRDHEQCRYFTNNIYQVAVRPWSDQGWLHINIRRRDGAATLRDWRHFQQIKNETVGPEREALELYPAESRKVDTSNKWHLWVLPANQQASGLGWSDRAINYTEYRNVPGMRQRPL